MWILETVFLVESRKIDITSVVSQAMLSTSSRNILPIRDIAWLDAVSRMAYGLETKKRGGWKQAFEGPSRARVSLDRRCRYS